jgi:hypothetical protein
MSTAASAAIDGKSLTLGGGLLTLVRPALDRLETGGVLAVISTAAVGHDLAAWCKLEGHRYLGERDGRHLLEKGSHGVPPGAGRGEPLPVRDGRVLSADVLAVAPFPASADASSGFAPRGARVEPGGPRYPVSSHGLAIPEAAALYDQAVAAQWTTADIPWERARGVPEPLESAVAQVMTLLAENELSALYVPSKFVARLHRSTPRSRSFWPRSSPTKRGTSTSSSSARG